MMAEENASTCILKEMAERLADIRYVCEANGWNELIYLLDMIGHQMQARLAPSSQVSVEPSNIPAQHH